MCAKTVISTAGLITQTAVINNYHDSFSLSAGCMIRETGIGGTRDRVDAPALLHRRKAR